MMKIKPDLPKWNEDIVLYISLLCSSCCFCTLTYFILFYSIYWQMIDFICHSENLVRGGVIFALLLPFIIILVATAHCVSLY